MEIVNIDEDTKLPRSVDNFPVIVIGLVIISSNNGLALGPLGEIFSLFSSFVAA